MSKKYKVVIPVYVNDKEKNIRALEWVEVEESLSFADAKSLRKKGGKGALIIPTQE